MHVEIQIVPQSSRIFYLEWKRITHYGETHIGKWKKYWALIMTPRGGPCACNTASMCHSCTLLAYNILRRSRSHDYIKLDITEYAGKIWLQLRSFRWICEETKGEELGPSMDPPRPVIEDLNLN